MRSKLFILILVSVSIAEVVKYHGYRVYRTKVSTENDYDDLLALENNQNYTIWSSLSGSSQHVDVMVSPEHTNNFLKTFPFAELFIDDVQTLIDNERPASMRKSLRVGSMDWESYHTYEDIKKWLKQLEQEHPGVVTVQTVGKSYEGRDIVCAHVSYNAANKQKTVMLEGGMHAREWIGVASVTYILNEVLNSKDKTFRDIAESHDWHICPIFNPDGYSYTFTNNRMWRKTRKPYGFCYGADPNRNWDYNWRSSWNPCAETYPGSRAFSEPETKAISEHLKKLGPDLISYFSFHSYSQLLLIPYGDSAAHRDNYDELFSVGKRMVEEIKNKFGTEYQVGNIVEILYPAYGNNVDWVKNSFKTRMTYIYELRDTGKYGFLLPPDLIIPSAKEALTGLVTMFQEFQKIDNNVVG